LFETEASWDDHNRRRYEIITTRIYLLLLTVAIMILVVYTAVTVHTESITEEKPSQSRFEELVSNPRYSPTLDCPCENISIPYESFISISPHYHQICLSDFIVQNSLWINLVHYVPSPVDYPYDDYRRFVVPHFRLLFYLCTLANQTFTDALSIFYSNTLVSKRAQSRQAVKTQMEAALDQFHSSIPQTFMRTLNFIRQITQGNGLISSISSNWYILPMDVDEDVGLFVPRSYGDSNCSCGTNSMCVSSGVIDGSIVPGFLVGCYPLESLLQSTLECLYNITCINRLKKANQPSNMTIHPLNSTLSFPNVTVQSLMNVLMVDRWDSSIAYDHYYAMCAPLSCTYVITDQGNPIYIITTIIGLCGGLTVALEVIVPVLVKIGRYLIMCHRRRIEPVVDVISNHE
jgi:hypothetical protein